MGATPWVRDNVKLQSENPWVVAHGVEMKKTHWVFSAGGAIYYPCPKKKSQKTAQKVHHSHLFV